MDFERKEVAFAAGSLRYAVRAKGTVCCSGSVRHFAAGLRQGAVCAVRHSEEPERAMGFVLVRRGAFFPVTVW